MLQGAGDLDRDLDGAPFRHRLLTIDDRLNRLSINVFHREEMVALFGLPGLDRSNEIRVAELCGGLGLSIETLQVLRIVVESFEQDLQGNILIALYMLGSINHAHRARPDLAEQPVVGDLVDLLLVDLDLKRLLELLGLLGRQVAVADGNVGDGVLDPGGLRHLVHFKQLLGLVRVKEAIFDCGQHKIDIGLGRHCCLSYSYAKERGPPRDRLPARIRLSRGPSWRLKAEKELPKHYPKQGAPDSARLG